MPIGVCFQSSGGLDIKGAAPVELIALGYAEDDGRPTSFPHGLCSLILGLGSVRSESRAVSVLSSTGRRRCATAGASLCRTANGRGGIAVALLGRQL